MIITRWRSPGVVVALATSAVAVVLGMLSRGPAVGHPPRLLGKHEEEIWSLDFALDDAALVTGTTRELRVWEQRSGRQQLKASARDSQLLWQLAKDSRRLAIARADGVGLIDLQTGVELHIARERSEYHVTSIALSNDSQLLAVADDSGRIRVWPFFGGEPLADFRDDSAALFTDMAFAEGSRTLIAYDRQRGELRALQLAAQNPMATLHSLPGQAVGGWFSVNGEHAVLASPLSTHLVLWGIPERATRIEITMNAVATTRPTFTADAQLVAVGTSKGTACLFQVPTGQTVATLKYDGTIFGLCFSPDGSRLAVAGVARGSRLSTLLPPIFKRGGGPRETKGVVSVWEVSTMRECARLTGTVPVRSLTFSRDGRILAIGGMDGSVIVWEPAM